MKQTKHILIFPMLLAWFIIFAHDTIPHHHHDDNHVCAHHSTKSNYKTALNKTTYHEENHDQGHCSFSVDILPEFSLDHLFTTPTEKYTSIPVPAKIYSYINYSNEPGKSNLYARQNQLRAPPKIA